MAKKVIVQPGVWIFLIALALVGVFFGIQFLNKNGSMDSITNVIVPKSKAQSSVKSVKYNGKRPLVVAENTWSGFAGSVYFNNGFQPNSESRFIKEFGVPVQIVKMDNFDDSRNAWKAGKVDIICNTADVLPTEIPNLMQYKPKVFMQIDWSRGGDKMVVRPGINTISDLKGKSIALALSSPSQTLLIRAIESGQIEYKDMNIKPMGTALDAAQAFKDGKVDAALVWSPDDEDCIAAVPGSKALISTKEAAFTIADVFYAKEEFINSHREEIAAFVHGCLIAAAEINSSQSAKDKATKLMATYFNVPEVVVSIDNARICTYGDNVNFFGLAPVNCNCVKGEDLYSKMAAAFNAVGLASNNVPPWRDITDISILQSLAGKFNGSEHNPEGDMVFSKPTKEMVNAPAIATKQITINFETGSYTLSDEAKYIIDKEFGNIARGFAGYRVRIEGNTDNVGAIAMNMSLSKKRAQAVADYLVMRYGFDRNRFVIIGNGPNNPVAPNDSETGKAQNRRTDFELIAN